MSKSSARVRVIQLQEWMKTLKSQRKKQVRSSNTSQRDGVKLSGINSNDVRIKNGPNGRR